MKSKLIFPILAIVYLAVIGFLMFRAATPKKEEISQKTLKVNVVTPESFKDQTNQEVAKFRQFGSIPVTVTPQELGKDNPFVQ